MDTYFTDSEYRILLSAMSREEKVCKKVDSESDEREPKLQNICRSINRKLHQLQMIDCSCDMEF